MLITSTMIVVKLDMNNLKTAQVRLIHSCRMWQLSVLLVKLQLIFSPGHLITSQHQ